MPSFYLNFYSCYYPNYSRHFILKKGVALVFAANDSGLEPIPAKVSSIKWRCNAISPAVIGL